MDHNDDSSDEERADDWEQLLEEAMLARVLASDPNEPGLSLEDAFGTVHASDGG